ncbi:hypothetical protein [Microbispora sp. ATCC PTA-5024]|uniref:hypothetical protein n=1 Tax=Microbispora sp. ATCC PTA-5024 TaxID=316330 RepID=UPI0003DC3F32|nr:hypothetical protein [Microbispora sp. ATCC PTA-5024]ETK34178.1 membrane protein [Microbispora sp. ATCC PTA-5024]
MTAVPPARSSALSLIGAGILFLLYPVVRPYSDEKSMAGARAMASSAWMAAHLFAVGGFILLTLGLLGLHLVLGRRLALRAVVATWIGVGLTLPYYGAEVFGLNVIGGRAVRDQDASLLELADQFRYGPVAMTLFGAGLLLLAVGAVMAAVAVWRSGTLPRWSGVPLAAGFVLFLPQFFGTPALRMAHGALIAAGGVWLGLALWRARRTAALPA